jgi:hypothetical protein
MTQLSTTDKAICFHKSLVMKMAGSCSYSTLHKVGHIMTIRPTTMAVDEVESRHQSIDN